MKKVQKMEISAFSLIMNDEEKNVDYLAIERSTFLLGNVANYAGKLKN